MIPEIGHYALVLALALGIVQVCVPFYGAQRNDPVLMGMAVPTAVAQLLFIGVAFAALTACYMFRQVYMTFFGEPHWHKHIGHHEHGDEAHALDDAEGGHHHTPH